jgi:hypothetical protein
MTRALAHVLAAGAVVVALSGCASTEPAATAPTGVSSSSTQPASAPAPTSGCVGEPVAGAPVEVTARLAGGHVDPFPRRVDVALGATVVLRIEADVPAEIHVHGYDRRADAAPGKPACIEVVADVPGVFEVEAHPDTLLLQLAVR